MHDTKAVISDTLLVGGATTLQGAATLSGATTLADVAALKLQTETIDEAGALSASIPVSILDSTAGAMAVTLAAPASVGDVKVVIMETDGGDATLTIAAVVGAGNTYTFANEGETAVFIGTATGWAEISRGSGAANAVSAFDGPAVATV
jgi:hypothetical protein